MYNPTEIAPIFSPNRTTAPMLSGRLEVFWFLLFFSVLFIIFDFFFYAVAEPVWMVSWFRSLERKGLACARFLREIRSPAGKEEDFSQNRPSARSCSGGKPVNTFAPEPRCYPSDSSKEIKLRRRLQEKHGEK